MWSQLISIAFVLVVWLFINMSTNQRYWKIRKAGLGTQVVGKGNCFPKNLSLEDIAWKMFRRYYCLTNGKACLRIGPEVTLESFRQALMSCYLYQVVDIGGSWLFTYDIPDGTKGIIKVGTVVNGAGYEIEMLSLCNENEMLTDEVLIAHFVAFLTSVISEFQGEIVFSHQTINNSSTNLPPRLIKRVLADIGFRRSGQGLSFILDESWWSQSAR